MMKKVLILMTVLAMLVLVFVGCDLTVDETTDTNSSTDSTTSTTASVTTATPPDPDNGGNGGLGGGVELPDDPL